MILTLYIPSGNTIKLFDITVDSWESTLTLQLISETVKADYFFWKIKPGIVDYDLDKLTEWLAFAQKENAGVSYSNFNLLTNGQATNIKTQAFSLGSIRDDFDFGALVLIQVKALKQFLANNSNPYNFAGWYSFRLWCTINEGVNKYSETCYNYEQVDLRKSGEKIFDYVDPQNRSRQIEMEQAATLFLDKIGAKVSQPFQSIDFKTDFVVEASVIIPVLNRKKTIADAVNSVLKQKTNFEFNLIIIDNHSTDSTSEIINSFNDDRIVHIIPSRTDLGIGGCWNEGVNHEKCGRFAVQLDSDDLYSDENTLQQIVDKFHADKCAMVIGSYQMVNFKLEEIPPGIIDHKEWTKENGPNNAIRINGLGAPRAFYTPIIRKIGFPNVSYGEDYAVALAISRTFKVGRIYTPIYLCRRWDNNTDSNLSIEKMNAHNAYKDSIRLAEIEARQRKE